MIRFLVGLGNPGPAYALTRHNAGWIFLDWLAERLGVTYHNLGLAEVAEWQRFRLVKPQTFMNLSGRVLPLIRKMEPTVTPEQILWIYDDVDLPRGTARLRLRGSAGSHNGMRSVLEVLPEDRTPRLRIGIGPRPEDRELRAFVLGVMSQEELDEIVAIFPRLWEGIRLWARGDVERAQQVVNQRAPQGARQTTNGEGNP